MFLSFFDNNTDLPPPTTHPFRADSNTCSVAFASLSRVLRVSCSRVSRLRPFKTKVWCVSAKPISQGKPRAVPSRSSCREAVEQRDGHGC